MSAPRRYRLVLTAILVVGLVAALLVAAVRVRKEHGANRVELVMDYPDFSALARSYGYDEEQFLVALRQAGLTSLAVSEELGGSVDTGTAAVLLSGAQVLAQARLAPLRDPTLADLVRRGAVDENELYLLVYDPSEVERYRRAIELHLSKHAVRTLRARGPTVFAIRSQLDFFDTLGLGLPAKPMALAHKLALLLVPRVQNDEHFGDADIDRIFAGFERDEKASTVVFFGQRNEVLGYPDHLDEVAKALESSGINFGTIEVYDQNQIQKGNEGLAERAIDRTARVQAISKLELDKLDFETVVARYLLGVRERNVRVVYLRPFLHQQGDLTLEKTNVELVRRIAEGLHARGFRLGRATPIPDFDLNPFVIALVSLTVPAIVLLLFEAFGVRRPRFAYLLFAADLALIALGYGLHHDLLVRKALALGGGIAFATMGVVAIPRAFTAPAPAGYGASLLAGLRAAATAYGLALLGALVVVGLLSVPLLMEEIDRFSGVKAMIVLPPLLAFALYVYTRRFGNEPPATAGGMLEPVRIYQVVILLVLAAGAVFYVARSGNQADIAPSAFELHLRSGLTAVLGVRPRFKEFLLGIPLLVLLPSIRLPERRAIGWLFAIAAAVGTSDVVDTFSHLHTPLVVSLVRVVNGAVLGAIVGAIAIALYRAGARALSAMRRPRPAP